MLCCLSYTLKFRLTLVLQYHSVIFGLSLLYITQWNIWIDVSVVVLYINIYQHFFDIMSKCYILQRLGNIVCVCIEFGEDILTFIQSTVQISRIDWQTSKRNLWYWPTNEGRDHDDVHFLLHRKFGNVPVTQLYDVLSEWRHYRDGVLESDGLPPRLHPVNVSSEFAKYSSPG